MEQIGISDIRDEATRNLFADLMESEGKTRVLMYSTFMSIIAGLGLFNVLILMPIFLRIHGNWVVASQIALFMTVMSLLVNNGTFNRWHIHDTIYRIKLPSADYQDRIGKWLDTEKFGMRNVGVNVFILKPNQIHILFHTILYAIQDDYAIVLAPKRRLKSFMKVFE